MRVQLLYFDDCPNYDATVELIAEVADGLGISVDVEQVRIESTEAAVRHGFIGSPSVRVDGIDVDPSALDRRDFGMACRRYGNSGVPPRDLIEDALRGANGNGGSG